MQIVEKLTSWAAKSLTYPWVLRIKLLDRLFVAAELVAENRASHGQSRSLEEYHAALSENKNRESSSPFPYSFGGRRTCTAFLVRNPEQLGFEFDLNSIQCSTQLHKHTTIYTDKFHIMIPDPQ